MLLTVAICACNPDQKSIVRALDAIAPQLSVIDASELIVVDNNSSPPLADRGFLSAYRLRLICVPTPGLTAAREAVIENAAGQVIVFVDDDNIVSTDYFGIVLRMFACDRDLALLGGSVLPEYELMPPSWLDEFEPMLAIRRYERQLHVDTTRPPYSSFFPVGAGLAVRRDMAVNYVSDSRATTRIQGRRGTSLSSGEDLDLGFFVLSRRGKLTVTGALQLTHVIPCARLQPRYLGQLAAGNVRSAFELETKWAGRLGCSLFPELSLSLSGLAGRAVAAAILGAALPRYRIKRRAYLALMRVRAVTTYRRAQQLLRGHKCR